MLVLGWQQAGVAVQRVPGHPVHDDPDRGPARGLRGQLAPDGGTADERTVAVRHATQHPAHAELGRRDPLVVGEGGPAVVPLDVDEREAGLDAQHHQRLLPEGAYAVAATRVEDRVEHVDRLVGLDGDLEPEVTGVAGAGEGHRRGPELGVGEPEERQRVGLGHQRREHGPRAGALDGEDAVALRDVLDLDAQPSAQVAEPAEVGAGSGQQEVGVGVPEDDAVLHHEAAVVAPQRVLRVAGSAQPDVADQHPGEELLGVGALDPVLVQRRGVEDADRVADREVLVLGGVGVAQRRQVALPVRVEALGVQLAQSGVERRRPDHGGTDVIRY